MRDKFGLEFRIVDSQLLRDLRRARGIHANPWTHFPRLITSVDFLKRERPLRLMREALPARGESIYPRRFDLLIVDEAHNVAPSGRGRYATDSLRTSAIRTIVPHFEHRLFLTATPHNGYQESFTALLELLDNQRFARAVRPDRQQLAAVMVRRLKSELPPRWDGTPRFPPREILPIEVDYTDAERHAHALLQRYTVLRRKAAKSDAERYASEFVLKLLKKRLFSSPASFAVTLAQHLRTLEGRARTTTPRAGLSFLRRQIEGSEEEYADDDLYDEATGDAVTSATSTLADLGDEERRILRDLEAWVANAAARPDSKAVCLIDWLKREIRPSGAWTNQRVIIFTEYRDTQRWLFDLLAAEGLTSGERLLTLYGGMNSDDRERVKAAFQARPEEAPVRILLATDAASEGLDLQNHCSRLIHYEIPWNPNRLEQRNGRIDRHGQRAPTVQIFHFAGTGYRNRAVFGGRAPGDLEGDLEFLMRAALKVQAIREDLGKVGPVIAAQVEEAMLGRRDVLDTTAAEQDAGRIRRQLTFERRLAEQIERLKEQLAESRRALRLEPERIQTVVEIAFQLAGQPPLREATLEGVWPDPEGRRARCPVFHLPPLTKEWYPCADGLAHPHTGVVRPITFDANVAAGRDDVVLAHLEHRLVQMSLRLLRAEVWSPESRRRLSRVAARLVTDRALDAPAVVAHGRLVVTGADGDRLHEELITAGGVLRAGRFARFGSLTEMNNALDALVHGDVPTGITTRLAELWPNHADALMASLEARQRERTGGLERFLVDRAAKEEQAIRAVLEELARAIRTELTGPEQPETLQLQLFTSEEQEQYARDHRALRDRLEQIPGEIEHEVETIRRRYTKLEPRLFPVAVTYLVPERIARQEGHR